MLIFKSQNVKITIRLKVIVLVEQKHMLRTIIEILDHYSNLFNLVYIERFNPQPRTEYIKMEV